jgi:hypothetical protein
MCGRRLREIDDLLERFCNLPNPVESESCAQRRDHQDLAKLTDPALRQERAFLRLWTPLYPDHDLWFDERIHRIEREMRRREPT